MFDLDASYKKQLSSISSNNHEIATMYTHGVDRVHSFFHRSWRMGQKFINQVPYVHSFMNNPLNQSQIKTHIMRFFSILGMTFKLLIAKFASIFVSIWVFVFASILGAMDGLLSRYIRTVEGGRESTFIFHRVSGVVIKIPVAIVFLYLSTPFFLNPKWVVMVMSLLFFGFFYIATANLKKFL